MKMASVIILALVGILVLLGSLVSAGEAYLRSNNQAVTTTMTAPAAGGPDFETAQRGRRGTAASFGAGFATFFLMIVLGPYRRGDRWAWWAILTSTLTVSVLVLLRMPFLGTTFSGTTGAAGRGTMVEALIMLGLTALGLALGAGRLKAQ